MQLTDEQEKAIRSVKRWLADRDKPYFCLGGYAGTGKTTITKLLAADLGGHVAYGAYTGKAAHVMARNGCVGATTIHRLIYQPKEKSRRELRRLEALLCEKKEGSPEADELRQLIEVERRALASPSFILNTSSPIRHSKLIVVDEVSMVDGQIGQDLLSFGVPLLVIGDPAQLPPVRGRGFFSMANPDAMLTKIHRQAQDNPIIRLATDVREGSALKYGEYGDSVVTDHGDARVLDWVQSTDQIIVGLRATRAASNDRMRELLGKQGKLEAGDKLVCLRNDHDANLMNGSLWGVVSVDDFAHPDDAAVCATLKSLDEPDRDELACELFTDPLSSGEAAWESKLDGIQHFTYGYAITCHKAQGSQFDDVVVFDESRYFRENSQRWLYTAITRAAKRITVIR